MAIGPVEYMVVAFPGNQFKGEILPALEDLVNSGTIRVLDLAVAVKDADGNVAGMEVEHTGSKAFQALDGLAADRGGLVTADDLQRVGEALEPNSSAALLVWEDLWASRFADAMRDAGGVLVDIQRIPREVVEAALAWNEENKAEIEAEEAAAARV
jgi:uncharacterized membrane protein